MPLQRLQFRPGIVKDTTDYSNEGGWYDCDKVRFRLGYPESIGGWIEDTDNEFLGTCRAIHQWTALDGVGYTAIGTNLKLYLYTASTYYDITPIRRTVTLGVNPFTTQSISNGKLTVTDAANGAVMNDFVTFSGATAFDNYTTGMLNAEHQIIEIISANTYTIEIAGITSAGAGVSGGGAAVEAVYQINTGPDSQVFGTGWGTGTYGRGTWGSAFTGGLSTSQLRLWSLDNFGEDLVANVRGGGVYYWQKTTGTSARAVALSSISGANQAPTIASGVMVSTSDRSIICFACNENGSSEQDLLLVRWSSQEDALEWEPRRDTTAGSQRISSGSQYITAIRSRQEIMTWTDRGLNTMGYVGPPYTFGFTLAAEGTTIMGPNAMASARNTLFWMDLKEFRMFNGAVSTVPCTVQAYVFNNLNLAQRYKIFAGTNTLYDEIWWFYPSLDSEEIDSYVIFNYVDNIWSVGTMERTAWWDASFSGYPIATADGHLFVHEYGYNAGDEALVSHVEGSDIDLGDGEQFFFILRLVPDVTITGTNDTGIVSYVIKRRNFPGQDFTTAYTSEVQGDTTQKFVRVRGRQFAMRVEANATNMGWRLGSTRVDIQPDGRKV